MELKNALDKIYEDLLILKEIFIGVMTFYFIWRSTSNIDLFNQIYLEPIIEFINEYILTF